ncbi:MAG: 50S ribosomal protein L4 [Acidobacteria bacterium]|jgi:large subunit ribosomal protein L4|nr:50S ribosomal protein L4 [Acidobacteriota bacterium]
MTLDIVNAQNEKIGSLDLRDELFGGRVKGDVIWQSVIRENASKRRGTHATKTRAMVSGTGKKPWKQKGTGRAQVGEARNPLWRHGGTTFGPQPRSYEYAIPRKQERVALREALAAKFQAGEVIVVDQFEDVVKTKAAAEMLGRFGATGSALVVDVKPAEALARALRNIPRTQCLPSGRLTARDVMLAKRVIATRAAVERLQEVLGS